MSYFQNPEALLHRHLNAEGFGVVKHTFFNFSLVMEGGGFLFWGYFCCCCYCCYLFEPNPLVCYFPFVQLSNSFRTKACWWWGGS